MEPLSTFLTQLTLILAVSVAACLHELHLQLLNISRTQTITVTQA